VHDPLAFYEEFVNDSIVEAEKPCETGGEKGKESSRKSCRGVSEQKKWCIELLEREVREKQTLTPELYYSKKVACCTIGEKLIGVGCYVDVTADLSVGKCSHRWHRFRIGCQRQRRRSHLYYHKIRMTNLLLQEERLSQISLTTAFTECSTPHLQQRKRALATAKSRKQYEPENKC